MTLRERLVNLRKKLGITRTEFAARIGVSAAYIHILENGKQEVTLRVLESISKSFNIPITYFFEDLDISDEQTIFIKKFPIKYIIDEKFKFLTGDFGEIFLENKYKEDFFLAKYKGDNIVDFNINKGDILLLTKFENSKTGDKILIIINNFVKFSTLSLNRGNIILIPSNKNDFCFLYEENKMKAFKIYKIIRIQS